MNRKVRTIVCSCHCIIHQEIVCGKVKRMDDTLKLVGSLVNFIHAEGLFTLPSWKQNPLVETTNLQIYINNMKVSNGSTSPIHMVLQSKLQKYTVTIRAEFFYNSKFLWFQTNEFCSCVYVLTWFTPYPMITVFGILVEMLTIALHYHLTFLLKESFLFVVASSVIRNMSFEIWSLVNVLFLSNPQ